MDMDEIVLHAESLRGANLQRYKIPDIEVAIQKLLLAAPGPWNCVGRSIDQVWHRGRKLIDGKRFNNLNDLIYPREPSSRFGRANYPGQRIFYASWSEQIASFEIGIEPGDIVQYIACRPRL